MEIINYISSPRLPDDSFSTDLMRLNIPKIMLYINIHV
jgi:hypothetical protein